MKSQKTIRHDRYKRELAKLIQTNPDSRKLNFRYKVMRWLLVKEWNNLMTKGGVNDDFLKDVVYIDRLIRKQTEGYDEELKTISSQEFQLEVLPKM